MRFCVEGVLLDGPAQEQLPVQFAAAMVVVGELPKLY